MFKRKKQTASVEGIGNVPPTAYDRAKAEWAERMGSATVNQGRLFVIAVLSVGGVIAMAIALSGLTPLKTVVPYTIAVDKLSGETRAVGITAERFTPNEMQKKYHLTQWVKQMLTLDAFTTERDLSEAFTLVRGKAAEQFREFVAREQPIALLRKDTALTRTVQPSSIQFLAENIAQLRVVTEMRSTGQPAKTTRYVVLVHFTTEPPQTEAEIYRNPIGLNITHFNISEELM